MFEVKENWFKYPATVAETLLAPSVIQGNLHLFKVY